MAENLGPQPDIDQVSLDAGYRNLVDGLNARSPRHVRFSLVPDDGIEGSGAVGTRNGNHRLSRPDDSHALRRRRSARSSSNEDVLDRAREEVA